MVQFRDCMKKGSIILRYTNNKYLTWFLNISDKTTSMELGSVIPYTSYVDYKLITDIFML